MNGSGASPLENALWVLLVIALLTAAIILLGRWFHKKSLDQVAKLQANAEQFKQRVNDILVFLQPYDGFGYEPYLTTVQKLAIEMQEIEARVQQLEQSAQSILSDIRTPSVNAMRALVTSPFQGYRHFVQSKALSAESAEIDRRLAGAETQATAIYELPWQVALEARQLMQQVDEMDRLGAGLKGKGAAGGSFQAAMARIPTIKRSLGDIPLIYRKAEQPELLQNTSLPETVQVYGVVSSVRPVIEHWLPLMRTWEHHHQKASSELTNTRQAAEQLRQSLAKPPEGLHAAPIHQRVEQVATMVSDLEQRLSKAEVDELRAMQREATRLRKLAEDAGRQFTQGGELAAQLAKALPEAQAEIDSLAAQLTALEKPEYPLVWDSSAPAIERVRQKLKAIGLPNQARTPDQISAALAEIARAREQRRELAGRYHQVSGLYQSLVSLLQTPEIKDGPVWIRKTREMAAQAQVYDPHNWPQADAVANLRTETESLAALQDQLAPAGKFTPVKESTIEQRLKDTQQLAGLHKAVRARADTVRARLEKIQALELDAKEKLKSAWSVVEKASILAESNELLDQAASPDIKRLGEEMKRAAEELNQRSQGLMEKKHQQAEVEAAEVYQAFQGWVVRLNTENAALAKQISDRLAELDAIALLEDPPFEEARALLAREDLRPPSSSLLKKSLARGNPAREALSEQEASAEIKRKNDLWQGLLAAQKALEEKCGPILQAYQEAAEARREAQERVSELNAHFLQRRAWPPHNQPPLADAQGLHPIDIKWDAMRKQPVRSDWAILELGRLAGQYHAAAGAADQLLERIDQDQDRIQELEDQIADLKERWVYMAQNTTDNAVFYHGVQSLISGADARLAHVRQQYIRGALSYDDALKSLHLLYDELRSTRVQFDDTHDAGLGTQGPNARKP